MCFFENPQINNRNFYSTPNTFPPFCISGQIHNVLVLILTIVQMSSPHTFVTQAHKLKTVKRAPRCLLCVFLSTADLDRVL